MESFLNWINANGATLVGTLGSIIAACSVLVGFSNKPKAQTFSDGLFKVAKFFSGLTFKDEPGTISIPLTDKDIVPKEPTP